MKLKNNRIYNWQNWHWSIFYIPVFFYYIFLSIKAKSLTFLALSNPNIKLGGLCGYSKFSLLKHVDKKYLPKTLYIKNKNEHTEKNILNFFDNSFPFILKPDIGERGFLVELIRSKKELNNYLNCAKFPLIAQEYIALKNEIGVMFRKLPDNTIKEISGITGKINIKIHGDGKSTIFEHINKIQCSVSNKKRYLEFWKEKLKIVLCKNQSLIIEPIGNHCRGTIFLDYSHKIDSNLKKIFIHISDKIPNFYLGRYDIKYNNFEDIAKGNFKIIEINAVNSEPTQIYSEKFGFIKAYKTLFEHWRFIYKIFKQNKKLGFNYPKLAYSLKEIKKHLDYKI